MLFFMHIFGKIIAKNKIFLYLCTLFTICMDNACSHIRLGDHLCDLRQPMVMAIVNATPDSFFAASRAQTQQELRTAFIRAVDEGADIIDIGACSTRPAVQSGDGIVSEHEEWQRLHVALTIVRQLNLRVPVSVDTFRPAIAKRAIEEFGVELINDISGKVFNFIGVLSGFHAGYVLTYNRANDEHKTANLLSDALAFFSRNVDQLHRAGISDVIIDPGFGFGQTVEESLSLLDNLSALRHIGCPILAGISRKRMAYQPAGLTPDTCLDETLRLERIALAQGARILRVHDVAATKQMITQIANE
jgi:dihydropteroate synthase